MNHRAIPLEELRGQIGGGARRYKTKHSQISLKGAVALPDEKLIAFFKGNPSQLRTSLEQKIEAGQLWIKPEGCNNFDSNTGQCLGH